MIRYWFEFQGDDLPIGLLFGCGVTAHTGEDAISIIKDTYFPGGPLPRIKRVVADVDVSTLDQNHVVPNMGSVVWRGIWWPRQPNEMREKPGQTGLL